jgi:hypothetical protein
LFELVCRIDLPADFSYGSNLLDACEAAARSALLPLAAERLHRAGLALPEEIAADAEATRRAYRALAEEQERTLALLLARFASVGISAVALKGPGLARRLHGDPSLRASADIDILVNASDLQAAARNLQALGWKPPGDPLDAQGLPRLHLELAHQRLPPVELHWRLHWHERRFGADVLARARGGALSREARPDDEFLMMLLTLARDGAQRVRAIADLAAWYRLHGDDGGDLVARAAQDYPAIGRALRTTEAIVRRSLLLPSVSGCGSRLAISLASSHPARTAEQRRAEATLFDLLVTEPGRRREVARLDLFPSRDVVSAWSGRTVGFMAVWVHVVRVLGRIGLAPGRIALTRLVTSGTRRGRQRRSAPQASRPVP